MLETAHDPLNKKKSTDFCGTPSVGAAVQVNKVSFSGRRVVDVFQRVWCGATCSAQKLKHKTKTWKTRKPGKPVEKAFFDFFQNGNYNPFPVKQQ